jgi:type I restriction-modification system DNA methylase subunit
MPAKSDSAPRTYEVTFCSRVAGWANALFARHPEWPFRRAEIEESKAIHRKRSDLRFYGDAKKLILAGEVKMPGTREGRSPHNPGLVEDSATKADNAAAEFFFTWNVNELVLYDRKKWNLPLPERRVQDYLLDLDLEKPSDVDRPQVEERIQVWLEQFFGGLAEIISGQQPEWGMRLDEWFIRAFESHISWAVKLTSEFLSRQSSKDKSFRAKLQEWMVNEQNWIVSSEEWESLVDRAARTLCYVFANRLIFYESCRAKFAESLAPLKVPPSLKAAGELYRHFQKTFQNAVDETGDYETLFYPQAQDWAGPHIFGHADSAEAWRSVIQNLEPFNFKLIPTDILGHIFQRIIEPEERHKFGQHYTNEDLVDVVNAFCIRDAEDNVLDPACGSGSFLVRAYLRKAWLKQNRRFKRASVTHQDRLAQIYGADISLFAAHLSTLNLAARDISDEENYPRIRRRNFFEVADDVAKKKPFCFLPQGLRGERKPGPIDLPPLHAVVGNPPYVRQELIPKRGQTGVKPMQAKEDLQELCTRFWPRLKLGGRADLHCYFWPAATNFLKEDGWFGFLVSSSWLDVEYGFALQEWVLTNFRIHAILESNAEPWFEDARIKTCAVILQRCSDAAKRNAQMVKFVRLDAPLKTILGDRSDENSRQSAAEEFREKILACKKNTIRDGWRVVVKPQQELWQDGLRAGRLFAMQKQRDLAEGIKGAPDNGDEEENGENGTTYDENGNGMLHDSPDSGYGPAYGGGKWGKYLRAPDLYFRIMEDYGKHFVPLGEITTIRFGVKSGCDAFFMPRDVSADFLEKYSKLDWNEAPLMTHCKRAEVESGNVKLIEAGDGTVHPVESEYLKPEVHSLMNVSRPLISKRDLDIVLMVSKPKDELKGTYVLKYLHYGETHSVTTNRKANAATVPKRSTCANRDPWYDLTYTKPGQLIWAKGQQYRHVVVYNENKIIANCRLYDVTLTEQKPDILEVFAAIANSTLVAYFKTFYGRYTGTEGSFEMMAIDLNLLEIPDPRQVGTGVAKKLEAAFKQLCRRDTSAMVEEEFMECRSAVRAKKLAEEQIKPPWELQQPDRRALDLAVLELLGVADAKEREELCDKLYHETAAHFRQIRVVEIQKQEQRARAEGREFRTDELVADLWDSLAPNEKQPLAEWFAAQAGDGKPQTIPEGQASLPDANDMLDASTVFFRGSGSGKSAVKPLALPSRAHAEIIFKLAQLGLHGRVRLPDKESAAQALKSKLDERLAALVEKAQHLAASRTSDDRKISDVSGLLQHWMIHGKPSHKRQMEA